MDYIFKGVKVCMIGYCAHPLAVQCLSGIAALRQTPLLTLLSRKSTS